MPKNKSPIVKKETLYRENKYGKKVKLGVELTREDGTTFSLLNPSGKAAKYFVENQRGKLYTNAGELKKGKDKVCHYLAISFQTLLRFLRQKKFPFCSCSFLLKKFFENLLTFSSCRGKIK